MMGADIHLLMGEVINNPEGEERDVEALLLLLLKSLVQEQQSSL